MSLQQQLQLKLSNVSSLKDIAQMMGYRKSSAGKAARRITNVLADRHLGLYSSGYDFKYSSDEFLSTLCRVLGINITDYQKDLNSIRDDYTDRRDRYKSYVFIDTGFKRENQPIFVLAFSQSQRYIQLEYEIRIRPIHEQVKYVQSLVAQHFKDTDGRIGIWGEVKRYVFFYAENSKLIISPDGIIMEETEAVNIARATLTVGGADIAGLINNNKFPQ